jgi:hypothetical protein
MSSLPEKFNSFEGQNIRYQNDQLQKIKPPKGKKLIVLQNVNDSLVLMGTTYKLAHMNFSIGDVQPSHPSSISNSINADLQVLNLASKGDSTKVTKQNKKLKKTLIKLSQFVPPATSSITRATKALSPQI